MVGLSRRTDPPMDLTDLASVDAALAKVGPVDGVACVAAAVSIGDVLGLSDDEVAGAVAAKLWGQVELVLRLMPGLPAAEVAHAYLTALTDPDGPSVVVPTRP